MATPSDEAATSSSHERTKPSSLDGSSQQTLQTPDFEEDFIVLDSLDEEEIDFCSPHFNPSVALKTDNVIVPSPDTPSFKSLSSYEDAVNRRKQLRASKDNSTRKGVTAKSRLKSDAKRSNDRSRAVDKVSRSNSSSKPSPSGRHQTSSSKASYRSSDTLKSNSENQKEKSQTASSLNSRSREGLSTSVEQHDRFRIRNTAQTKEKEERGDQNTLSQQEDEKKTSKQPQRREMRNVFTRMEAMSGPLSLLTRCVKNREHVRVVTRGAVTLSSICRGYIVAFDKYCNMAMIDVDEIYRRPAALGKVKARISHKLLDAQKTLKQESKEQQLRWQAEQNQPEAKTDGPNDTERLTAAMDRNQNIPNTNLDASAKDLSTVETEKRTKSDNNSNQEARTEPSHFTSVKTAPDSKLNLKLLKSVYSNSCVPRSRYEREALLLGIPDENVEHRHLNQLLLRGENVVSVSIIQEF